LRNDHEREEDYQVVERPDSKNPTDVELANRDRPDLMSFLEKQEGNEKAAQDKEKRDGDASELVDRQVVGKAREPVVALEQLDVADDDRERGKEP
jgi:hypothetical protein